MNFDVFPKPAYKCVLLVTFRPPPPPLYTFVCISVDPPPPLDAYIINGRPLSTKPIMHYQGTAYLCY